MTKVSEKGSGLLWGDIEDTYVEIDRARRAHAMFKVGHAILRKASENGGQVGESIMREVLEGLDYSIGQMQPFLNACLDSVHITQRPTPASAHLAEQVLAIPELCEQILLCLKPRDILDAAQLNRDTWSVFEGSPKLMNKLSFRHTGHGFLSSVFRHNRILKGAEGQGVDTEEYEDGDFTEFYGFEVNFRTLASPSRAGPNQSASTQPRQVTIEAWFPACDPLPIIGSRCRSMLICQPAVRVMQITMNCCPDGGRFTQTPRRWALTCKKPNSRSTYGESEEPLHLDEESTANNDVTQSFEIKNRTGITVGDVYDAAERLRDAHAMCPHATLEMHHSDGTVCPVIRFHSDLTLKNDDPYLIAKADAMDSEVVGKINQNAEKQTLEMYIRAKQKAWNNGWIIPTYGDFKSKHQKPRQRVEH